MILTDPQYGISFMAKDWDKGLPDKRTWAECFRVLKPGAFILVMASPRNDDLVSVSLREAGFVKHNKIPFIGAVPSQIFWVYGSGFPKGTDVSKAIDKKAIRAWLSERDHGLTASEVEKVISAAVNGEAMPETYRKSQGKKDPKARPHPITPEERKAGTRLIEQLESKFGEMPKRVKVGDKIVTCGTGDEYGKVVGDDGKRHTVSITAPATAEAAEWEGYKYGIQHLKPASEIILVFQKPYDGPPLESILRWGVGAVNVDAGRIGTGKTVTQVSTKGFGANFRDDNWEPPDKPYSIENEGRYPSNFLVSHLPGCRVVGERRVKGTPVDARQNEKPGTKSIIGGLGGINQAGYADADGRETVKEWACVEGCPVAELDRQSGESKSVSGGQGKPIPREDRFADETITGRGGHNDTGGASRFFAQPEWGPADYIYIPKASSAERNAGCEGLPQKSSTKMGEFTENPGRNVRKSGGDARVGNPHPT